MDTQWLQNHVDGLKKHLIHFQQMQHRLEDHYQLSLQQLTDPALKSVLMEKFSLHVDRQQKAVQKMNDLYKKALDQLAAAETI